MTSNQPSCIVTTKIVTKILFVVNSSKRFGKIKIREKWRNAVWRT